MSVIFVLFMAFFFKKKFVKWLNEECRLYCVLVLLIMVVGSSDSCNRFIIDALVDPFF